MVTLDGCAERLRPVIGPSPWLALLIARILTGLV